jgi:CBS-domain-containing membrane protein
MFSKLKSYFSAQAAARKERGGIKSIILQSAIILICLSLILMFYEFLGGIIVASLGASSFILFVTPQKDASRAANLIGGYVFGALSGVLLNFLHAALSALDFAGVDLLLIVVCAASAALTTFLMAWTGLAHPPSAALALGLAADAHCLRTAAIAIVSIIFLCAVRRLLKGHVKDLL